MTTIEILGVVLGSNVVTSILTSVANRRTSKATADKLETEMGQINLEKRLKVTEFYKEQLANLVQKYESLEKRLDLREKEYTELKVKYESLEIKHNSLKRDFTLFKTQNSHLI